ncbi:HNH endonuclease, partial [Promicromonospora sp. NPDC060271]|uniref:HNH endonuclease n=1 Tax=Promicromonospora sp. NPDC060271 TaxID=3347089 RepID=UPI0036469E68
EDRVRVDEEVCGPARLAALGRMGTKRLVARIRELAGKLDVHACVQRNARAVSERGVSVRPAPDLMVYLTALVPMQQGVQAYALLKAQADAAKAGGDERGAGQIMADTLIERVTGREPGRAGEVPVTINLLVSDQTLLADGDEPAVVLEGAPAGVGTVPAPVARNLAAQGLDADAAWLRAVYVDPRGRLLATTSTSRFHPRGLAQLLRAREQGICASSWCDAPVRHIDHITPHAEGGQTSLANGQGLCVRCNHAKRAPGWTQQVTEIDGRHAVETTMPTGHTSVFVAPAPPRPVAAAGSVSTRDEYTRDEDTRDEDTRDEDTSIVPSPAAPVRELDLFSGTVPDGGEDDAGRATPSWTPAVGMTGPAPGRVPRSRYSIGCHTGRDRGAIAYRPPGRHEQVGPGRRPRSRPDLTWAHPPGARTSEVPAR